MEGHSLVDCSPAAPAAQTLDNYLRAFRMLPACGAAFVLGGCTLIPALYERALAPEMVCKRAAPPNSE